MDHSLLLPFHYDVTALASSRHRVPHTATVSEYAFVPILELSRDEMVLAIVDDGYEVLPFDDRVSGPVYAWKSQLFRPAVNSVTGETFDATSFEDAVSRRYANFDTGKGGEASPFKSGAFPTPGIRLGLRERNPLRYPSLDDVAIELGWKPTRRILRSTRQEQLAAAQRFLAGAIVSVEGRIHVACPEPVWAVDRYVDETRIRLEPRPRLGLAFEHFRLDRLDEARQWARAPYGECADPPDAQILDPAFLDRDDEWALAAFLVTSCANLRGPLDWEGNLDDEPVERAGIMLQVLRDEGRLPREEEVEELLQALVASMEAAENGVLTEHVRTQERLEVVRDRWLTAARAGRGPGNRQRFDPRDEEALADLARGWG